MKYTLIFMCWEFVMRLLLREVVTISISSIVNPRFFYEFRYEPDIVIGEKPNMITLNLIVNNVTVYIFFPALTHYLVPVYFKFTVLTKFIAISVLANQ